MDAQSCLTLSDPMDPTSLLCPDFPDKNNGAGCHFLLGGIFLTKTVKQAQSLLLETQHKVRESTRRNSFCLSQKGGRNRRRRGVRQKGDLSLLHKTVLPGVFGECEDSLVI